MIRKYLLAALVVLAFVAPQAALAARPFAQAYNNVTKGAFARAANSVMTCDRSRESSNRCDAIESTSGTIQFNNNDTYTRWIDVDGVVDLDGVPGDDTYNSSRADLAVPAAARIAWAGLYWHGNTKTGPDRTATAPGSSNEVLLQVPGANYASITATWCSDIGNRYACFADVTSRVEAPAGGTYAVANVRANAGEDDYVGGWELLVVYEDDSLPLRSLTIFDGHQQYGGGTSRTFVVDNFLTPLLGPISAEAGFTVAEGDRGSSDTLRFQSEFAVAMTTITNDLGDGSITQFGAPVTTRDPAYRNTLGHDSDVFDVGSLMVNGARQATISLPSSSGETNELVKVDFAVDVYFPEVSTTKRAVDLNGGELVVGDTIRYQIEIENAPGAQDTAVKVVLTDELSPLLEYVPGSINLVTSVPGGAAVGPKTDVSGDDVAEWDSTTRTLEMNVGVGATSADGGSLAPGEIVELTFDVRVLPAAASQPVTNSAVATYEGATLASSNRVRVATASSDDPTTVPKDDTVIEPTPIFVTIDQPTDGALTNDPTPPVAGRSLPGRTVTVVFDEGTADEQTVTTTTNSAGDWFFFAPALADGSHTIVARIDDGFGGTEEDSVQLDVDTTAPTVAISSPADGAAISDSSPEIRGTATPGESVDVSIDGARVATVTADSSGDWTYQTVTPLADGSHVVVARVRDDAGNSGSASSQFEVDTVAPAVALSTPQDGATVGSSTPIIAGTSEPGADVEITIDGTVVATVTADASGDWSYLAMTPLADGMHTVSVEAFDDSGNGSGAVSATFTVDTMVPYVQISQPGDGTVVADATPTVTGSAEPNSLIQIEVDGVFVGSAASDANGGWSFVLQMPLSEGSHTVVANINDGTNSSKDSTTFEVDLTAPTLTITSPADGTTTGANPTITGTSEPGATIVVTLPDGQEVTTTADSNGDWSATTPTIPEGPTRILVTARDEAGNATSDTVDVVVDVTDPAVTITNPDDNSTKSDPRLTFEGTTDEPNAEVVLVLDGVEVARTTADANGDWSSTPTNPIADGVHDLLAFVEDSAGNRGEDVVEFIVDTRAPSVAIVAPGEGEVVIIPRPVISGTGEPGEVVSIFIDGTKVAEVTVDSSGDWTYTPGTDLSDGVRRVRVVSTDAAGNSGNDESTFVVDTVPPFVTVVVPGDGSVIGTDAVAIAGRTKAGELVEIFFDGTKVGEAVAGPGGEWTFVLTGISEGQHSVEARVPGATDTSNFTVDLTAPEVSVTSPEDGDLTNDSTPEVTGTAEPGAVVEIFIDGTRVGEVTADANGEWSYTSDELDDGDHAFEARTTDDGGNSATSGTIVVTIDTTGPSLNVDSPKDGESVKGGVTVSGTAEPGSVVEIFVDGEKVGEATADGDGSWSVDIGEQDEGEREIVVVASDPAGNETEVGPVVITIVIDSGTNNGTNNGTNGNNDNNQTNNGTGPVEPDDDPYVDSYLAGGCSSAGQDSGAGGLLTLMVLMVFIGWGRRSSKRRRSTHDAAR